MPGTVMDYAIEKKDGNSRLISFTLSGGCVVEAAVIDHWQEIHVCLPTMAGCPVSCRHCATTYSEPPFIRNLTAVELTAMGRRLLEMAASTGLPRVLSFSGHGEPLLNWAAVESSAKALGGGADKLYVTTIGIPSVFRQVLSADQRLFTFFLSLHGSRDKERNRIIPRGPDRSDATI